MRLGNYEKNAERMLLNKSFLPSKSGKLTIKICFLLRILGGCGSVVGGYQFAFKSSLEATY